MTMEDSISAQEMMELFSKEGKAAIEANVGGKRVLVTKEEGNKHIGVAIRFTPDELYEFLIDMTILAKAKGRIPDDPTTG